MRTSVPSALPLFRSEMQVRLLGLLILQPERTWTLAELSNDLGAPPSSVHRELARAESAGLIARDTTARPHRFTAAADSPLYEPMGALLSRSVGIETDLRSALSRPDVQAAVTHGSWVRGGRRPDSDIDVLVVGDASLRDLRSSVRPIGKAAGRTIDITVLSLSEFRQRLEEGGSYIRSVLEGPTTALVGDLQELASR